MDIYCHIWKEIAIGGYFEPVSTLRYAFSMIAARTA